MQPTTSDLFERWHPYWNWECFQSGMWGNRSKSVNNVQRAARLLANPALCRAAMERAIDKFPISAEQHLSKPVGRRPWIGQAACCVEIGALEEETRIAWNFYMTKAEQDSANEIADQVIGAWERNSAR